MSHYYYKQLNICSVRIRTPSRNLFSTAWLWR